MALSPPLFLPVAYVSFAKIYTSTLFLIVISLKQMLILEGKAFATLFCFQSVLTTLGPLYFINILNLETSCSSSLSFSLSLSTPSLPLCAS